MITLITFKVNKYPGYPKPAWSIKDPDDLAEQAQADSVRVILDRFARQAITPDPPQRAAYADIFDDGEDLQGERISNLLNQPDLSGMSEVEMHEFIASNTELKPLSDFNKSENKASEGPGTDPEPGPTQTAD